MPLQEDRANVPIAINDQGQVVGRAAEEASFAYGSPEKSHMYLFENGQSRYIGNGMPRSINDLGQVVGNDWPNNFLYENGQKRLLDVGSDRVFVSGTNNNGTIVGYSDGQGSLPKESFYLKGGVRTDFNIGMWGYSSAINDNDVIVGCTDWRTQGEAFMFDNGNLQLITSGGGKAEDINNSNQIAGHTYVDGVLQPYLWENGTLTMLGSFGGRGRAWALNNHGNVVGDSVTGDGTFHAFLYRDGTMYDLNDLVSNKQDFLSTYGNWTLQSARDINDDGWIIATVPEPTSLLLLGLGSLAFRRRQ